MLMVPAWSFEAATMPSAQPTATHVDVLQKEMLDYERDIRKLLKGQHSAIHMRNAHKDYYYYLIIKLEQISRQKEHFQAELYSTCQTYPLPLPSSTLSALQHTQDFLSLPPSSNCPDPLPPHETLPN